MKTKLIILAAAVAAVLYSCSNDRDEEVRQEAIEKVKASNQKQKIKLNKSGIQSREAEPEAAGDTIKVRGLNSVLSDDPDANLDPIDGGDPTTITPPKR